MRLVVSVTALAALVALSASVSMAQEAEDPVTYTSSSVVYTAILDGDLDTVSNSAVATLTTDVNGDTITYQPGLATATPTTTSRTTATATQTTDDGDDFVGGGVSDGREISLLADNAGAAIVAVIGSASNGQAPAQGAQDDNGDLDSLAPLHFQSHKRRAPAPSPRPDQPENQHELHKRQVALGGGAAPATTQTGLQTISGYTPPTNTRPPEPQNVDSGSILLPSQIPGYSDKGNTNNEAGSSSSQSGAGRTARAGFGQAALGALTGAVMFVLV